MAFLQILSYFGWKALYLSKKMSQTKLEILSTQNFDLSEKSGKVVTWSGEILEGRSFAVFSDFEQIC